MPLPPKVLRHVLVHPIRGDGNCLFRAVAQGHSWAAHQVFLSAREELQYSRFLRALSVRGMMNAAGRMKHTFTPFLHRTNGNAYMRTMLRDKEYGTELEVRSLSEQLRIPIGVYQRRHGEYSLIVGHGTQFCGVNPILLRYDRGSKHYEVLYPVVWPAFGNNSQRTEANYHRNVNMAWQYAGSR